MHLESEQKYYFKVLGKNNPKQTRTRTQDCLVLRTRTRTWTES